MKTQALRWSGSLAVVAVAALLGVGLRDHGRRGPVRRPRGEAVPGDRHPRPVADDVRRVGGSQVVGPARGARRDREAGVGQDAGRGHPGVGRAVRQQRSPSRSRSRTARRRRSASSVSPSARIVASVPAHCNLIVRSEDGSIRIERVDGKIDLRSGDGSVTGIDLTGTVRVHTGDGSMRFDNVSGALDLESGDGGARVSGRLQAVKLKTGDGSVEVRAPRRQRDGRRLGDPHRRRRPEARAARVVRRRARRGDGRRHRARPRVRRADLRSAGKARPAAS